MSRNHSPCTKLMLLLAMLAPPGGVCAQELRMIEPPPTRIALLANIGQEAGPELPGPGPDLPSPGVAKVVPVRAEPMRVEELMAIAMANNPTIEQAERRIAALQGRHLQVGLRPNPIVGYEGEEIGAEGNAGQQGMFLGQELVTANKLGLNRQVVCHEIEQARRDLEIQQMRVSNAVRTRVCDVVVAQRNIDLNVQLVKIGEAGVEAAEKLFQAQEVSRVDVLQARVEANTAKVALKNARNEYQAAWRRLVIAMGVPEMEPKALADKLDETPQPLLWDASLQRLLHTSPELMRAWSAVEQAKCALARAEAGRTPNIDLGAAVRYNTASESTVASVGVGVPLQIYDWNQGNISEARAELVAAHREVRRVELVLQDRLAEVFKRHANAVQEYRQYKDVILTDADSSLELVRLGYQQGEFGYLELLTAQRTYFRVHLTCLESLQELWGTRIEIDGLLLTGALIQPGQSGDD